MCGGGGGGGGEEGEGSIYYFVLCWGGGGWLYNQVSDLTGDRGNRFHFSKMTLASDEIAPQTP